MDIDKEAVASAIEQEAIDSELTPDMLNMCDIVIISLHPRQTIDFIEKNKNNFKKGGIVFDTCGVKGSIVSAAEKSLEYPYSVRGDEICLYAWVDGGYKRVSNIIYKEDISQ